jgi:hypothetical protein
MSGSLLENNNVPPVRIRPVFQKHQSVSQIYESFAANRSNKENDV